MINEDDGPAFPVTEYNESFAPRSVAQERRMLSGMSLRDYFAARAMQSLITDPAREDQSCEECARLSYRMADAMLKERTK